MFILLQKHDGYFDTKCFNSVLCVVTHMHSCKQQFNGCWEGGQQGAYNRPINRVYNNLLCSYFNLK